MDLAAESRYSERRKRIRLKARSLPPIDLIPLAAAVLLRMSPGQQAIARTFSLLSLAEFELLQQDQICNRFHPAVTGDNRT